MYDNAPSVLEAMGDGSWRYRWDIKSEETQAVESGAQTRSQWACEEVTVWPPFTANDITEAVITEKYAPNYEQKLVNDYNAVQLGVTKDKDGAAAARYKAFLADRAALKAKVDEDCKMAGVKTA